MATATTNDMQFIAQDSTFRNRVKVEAQSFCIQQINNKTSIKPFCASVALNIENYWDQIVWAVAANATVANEIVTTGNANASFVQTPAAGVVATAIFNGLVDADLNNAVANVITAMANL